MSTPTRIGFAGDVADASDVRIQLLRPRWLSEPDEFISKYGPRAHLQKGPHDTFMQWSISTARSTLRAPACDIQFRDCPVQNLILELGLGLASLH